MNKVKIVCRALITNDQNQVLFTKKTNSDFWSLPGGKLDPGDTNLQACLVRELQEELGVVAKIEDIRFVQELHKNDMRYIELIWGAKILNDTFCIPENIFEISGGELTDIKWIGKDNLRNANIKPEFLKNIV